IPLILILGKFKIVSLLEEFYNEINLEEYEQVIIGALLISNIYFYSMKNNYKIMYGKDLYILLMLCIVFVLVVITNYGIEIREIYKRKKKLKTLEKKVISYRLKESEKLIKLIRDEDISSLLVDDKIGNGKTYLIEYFLKKYSNEFEIIYIKLPLIYSIEELKQALLRDIKGIFRKNRINSNFLQDLLKISGKVKFSKFEVDLKENDNKKNGSTWDEIKGLKKRLLQLEKKGKSILVIIDDIERVFDLELLKNSIFFLGEFSEYFRETKTTTLFLAEYDFIKNKITEYDKNFNLLFLDKYFKYKLKLNTPKIIELDENDFKKILLDSYTNYSLNNKKVCIKNKLKMFLTKNNKNNNFLEIESHLDYLQTFFEVFYNYNYNQMLEKTDNANIQDDIRNLIRYIKKINPLLDEGLYNFTAIIYSIYAAIDLFLPQEQVEEKMIIDLFKNIVSKNKQLSHIEYDSKIGKIFYKRYKNNNLIDNYEFNPFDKLLNYLATSKDEKINIEDFKEINIEILKELLEKLDLKKFKKLFNNNLVLIDNNGYLLDNIIYKILEFKKEIFLEDNVKFNILTFLENATISNKIRFRNYLYEIDEKKKLEQENNIGKMLDEKFQKEMKMIYEKSSNEIESEKLKIQKNGDELIGEIRTYISNNLKKDISLIENQIKKDINLIDEKFQNEEKDEINLINEFYLSKVIEKKRLLKRLINQNLEEKIKDLEREKINILNNFEYNQKKFYENIAEKKEEIENKYQLLQKRLEYEHLKKEEKIKKDIEIAENDLLKEERINLSREKLKILREDLNRYNHLKEGDFKKIIEQKRYELESLYDNLKFITIEKKEEIENKLLKLQENLKEKEAIEKILREESREKIRKIKNIKNELNIKKIEEKEKIFNIEKQKKIEKKLEYEKELTEKITAIEKEINKKEIEISEIQKLKIENKLKLLRIKNERQKISMIKYYIQRKKINDRLEKIEELKKILDSFSTENTEQIKAIIKDLK
ncbi:MAG: hypothetical protein ACRC18_02700, partial [Cetobacterium sp.]